jgi:hypothetical protein
LFAISESLLLCHPAYIDFELKPIVGAEFGEKPAPQNVEICLLTTNCSN